MKKMNLCLLMTVFLFGIDTIPLTAQEQINYIIVKTSEGEIASFNPAAVNRQYIESEKWIFELKENNQQYSYPLEDVLPFTTEMRNQTNIDAHPSVQSNWSVYDDGNNLVIINSNGKVGYYTVHDISGKLVRTGYEDGNKATIHLPSGRLYIVKADGKAEKVVKQ
jgi:hypothetical protein